MKSYLTLRNGLILLAVLLFLIAWNRGITLLYGMFVLVVAVLLVSLLLPKFGLRSLSAERICDSVLTENESLKVKITLHNYGWFTRYLIELIQPNLGLVEEDPTTAIIFSIKQKQSIELNIPCLLRGVHSLPPLYVKTGFPLGLIEKKKTVCEIKKEILVYPSPFRLFNFPYISATHIPIVGTQSLSRKGGSQEFIEVREYQRGDSPKHIHWPQTARQNTLMVREYEFMSATEVTILLNLNQQSNIGKGKDSTLEYAIKIAASISKHACSNGHHVRLLGYGETEIDISTGTGQTQYENILYTLAKVKSNGNIYYETAIENAVSKVAQGGVMILFDSPFDNERYFEPTRFYARHIKPVWIRFNSKSFINPIQLNKKNPFETIGDIPIFNIFSGDDLVSVFESYK